MCRNDPLVRVKCGLETLSLNVLQASKSVYIVCKILIFFNQVSVQENCQITCFLLHVTDRFVFLICKKEKKWCD